MKIKRVLALACACTALPFTMAACGESYDRAEFIDGLVQDNGIPESQAICITDGLEEEFGVDGLNDRFNSLSEEDEATVTDLTIACVLGDG